jgi:hypothetical protein
MGQMSLNLRADLRCHIAVQVIPNFHHEIRAIDHAAPPLTLAVK